MVSKAAGSSHRPQYGKRFINLVDEGGTDRRVWVRPLKTVINIGADVAEPQAWVKRFEDAGLFGRLRRGNKTAVVTVTPETFEANRALLADFIDSAFADDALDPLQV